FVRRDGVWINPFRVDEQELDDSDEEWVESEEEEEENQVIAPAAANAEELSDRELLMNLIASVNALGVKVDHMQGTLDQLVANQQQQPPSP
ncbi:5-formyltetrahydrofolate cyclo-ligase, partial [Corchorus capsularis]